MIAVSEPPKIVCLLCGHVEDESNTDIRVASFTEHLETHKGAFHADLKERA